MSTGGPSWNLRSAQVLRHGGVIAPDECLPWPQTLAMGVQHVVAMFGATVLAPILMGFDPNLTILMSGVGTLIFFLLTGGKVPSYLGSSFAFIGVVTRPRPTPARGRTPGSAWPWAALRRDRAARPARPPRIGPVHTVFHKELAMTPALSPLRPALRTLSAAALLAALVACATGPKPDASAVAELQATRGSPVTGSLRFAQFGNKLRVSGQVSGLKPGAEHGFHVHEKGDCSSGDGMSTGGHFNPMGAPHGRHGQGSHHVGDLPPLGADSYGVARVDFETDRISLSGANSVLDKGLIVHRDPDDYTTQPTGNAGPRLACAVIRAR